MWNAMLSDLDADIPPPSALTMSSCSCSHVEGSVACAHTVQNATISAGQGCRSRLVRPSRQVHLAPRAWRSSLYTICRWRLWRRPSNIATNGRALVSCEASM